MKKLVELINRLDFSNVDYDNCFSNHVTEDENSITEPENRTIITDGEGKTFEIDSEGIIII